MIGAVLSNSLPPSVRYPLPHVYYHLWSIMPLSTSTTTGTLISFQEGAEGDPFDEVRQRISNRHDKMHTHMRGASYLLTQLIGGWVHLLFLYLYLHL